MKFVWCIIHRNSTLRNIRIHCIYIETLWQTEKNNTPTAPCQQKIEPHEIMVFFDGTSLYTSIPIDQALLIIKDLLEHDDKLADRTLFSPRQILDLLDILPHTIYFKFNGDFYQQTDGAAMGGPTSAIFSEIYMQSLDNCHHNSRPPF